MKIWVIGRGYPTTSNKMWGSFELDQAKLLAGHGNEVTYISLTFSFFNRKDPRGLRVFQEDNVKIYTYSHFYFPGKLGIHIEKLEDRYWKKLFDRVCADVGMPDVIHIHYPSMISSVNVIEDYRKKGIKIYATEHWSRVLTKRLRPFELERLKYYAEYSSCFISVSSLLQEAVKEQVDVKVPMKVIPNVLPPVFTGSCKECSEDVFSFIAVGRLSKVKRFDVVIQQFQKTFRGNPKIRLVIVGGGDEQKSLKRLASNSPQIIFTGEIPHAEVVRQIRQADTLVCFSKYETFGVPIIEAWACGKPVIASDKVGVVSYFGEKTGEVVPVEEHDMLGNTMKKFVERYDEYDHNYIAGHARNNFSDDVVYNNLHILYESY